MTNYRMDLSEVLVWGGQYSFGADLDKGADSGVF